MLQLTYQRMLQLTYQRMLQLKYQRQDSSGTLRHSSNSMQASESRCSQIGLQSKHRHPLASNIVPKLNLLGEIVMMVGEGQSVQAVAPPFRGREAERHTGHTTMEPTGPLPVTHHTLV
jgi:hypothetical protein